MDVLGIWEKVVRLAINLKWNMNFQSTAGVLNRKWAKWTICTAKQSNSAAKKKWFANEDDMLEYTRMEMYKFLHIEYRSIGFGW